MQVLPKCVVRPEDLSVHKLVVNLINRWVDGWVVMLESRRVGRRLIKYELEDSKVDS